MHTDLEKSSASSSETAAFLYRHVMNASAFVQHFAVCFIVQAENRPACSRFTAARLADKPERLPFVNIKTDSIDRFQLLSSAYIKITFQFCYGQ